MSVLFTFTFFFFKPKLVNSYILSDYRQIRGKSLHLVIWYLFWFHTVNQKIKQALAERRKNFLKLCYSSVRNTVREKSKQTICQVCEAWINDLNN